MDKFYSWSGLQEVKKMYNEKILSLHQETSGSSVSMEERYEMIARAVMNIEERKLRGLGESEQTKLWDTNDIEINFGEVIGLYE